MTQTQQRGNMKESTRRQGMRASGAATVFASAIAMAFFAIVPPLALAAVPPSRNAAQENPRFASLQIEIWPEFDRRAALVILKGELAPDLALPAPVSLRIPASSGGPSAVAFATTPKDELLNLTHDRTYGDDFIALRFMALHRFIHIEFYDPLVTSKSERSYTYSWPGDVAVDRLSVRLQEPAAASNITVQPDLGAGVEGPNGLLYRTAELGTLEAGKQLPITIRYTKTDSRTSTEILGVNAPDSTPAVTTGSREGLSRWPLILAVAAALVMGAGVAAWWWRRRRKAFGLQAGGAGFCPQCGSRLASGARFCSTCGTPVRNK
jgi:hypothetical protein